MEILKGIAQSLKPNHLEQDISALYDMMYNYSDDLKSSQEWNISIISHLKHLKSKSYLTPNTRLSKQIDDLIS
jgi:hypothetical protein